MFASLRTHVKTVEDVSLKVTAISATVNQDIKERTATKVYFMLMEGRHFLINTGIMLSLNSVRSNSAFAAYPAWVKRVLS